MHLNMENENYGDHHRLFLQCMLNKQVVTMDQALELYLNLKTKTGSASASNNADSEIQDDDAATSDAHKIVQKFVEEINASIAAVNLKIKLTISEATNKKVYVLYTINENDITKAANARCVTQSERELLRAVIKAVVTSPSGKSSEIACMNLTSQMTDHITKKEICKLLGNLTRQKWIEMVDGHVYLGPRVMVELKKFLAAEYEDQFDSCRLCKDPTLLGGKCPSCGIRVHSLCLESYFKKAASRKCVDCKKPWPEDTTVSYDLEDDEDEEEF